MSYNITSITITEQEDFGITDPALRQVVAELGDDYAETWDPTKVQEFVGDGVFWWDGERSDLTFDKLLEVVLPKFHGKADMVVCWEGGDTCTGIRVDNGVVTEHEVVMRLGEVLEDE